MRGSPSPDLERFFSAPSSFRPIPAYRVCLLNWKLLLSVHRPRFLHSSSFERLTFLSTMSFTSSSLCLLAFLFPDSFHSLSSCYPRLMFSIGTTFPIVIGFISWSVNGPPSLRPLSFSCFLSPPFFAIGLISRARQYFLVAFRCTVPTGGSPPSSERGFFFTQREASGLVSKTPSHFPPVSPCPQLLCVTSNFVSFAFSVYLAGFSLSFSAAAHSPPVSPRENFR